MTSAERVRLELESVAQVVKRMDHDTDAVVLKNQPAVAAQFRGDDSVRVAVVALHREVDVLLVEGHPQLGPLARRLSFQGILLDELRERGEFLIHVLVKAAIHPERQRRRAAQ